MNHLLFAFLFTAAEEGPAEPSNAGVGAVVLTIAVSLFLVWIGYLFLNSRRRAATVEETPPNLQPYLSDDELESSRVTRVLNSAVVTAAVLAIVLPVYYMNEGSRQAAAAEKIDEQYVEEGEHWFETFSCIDCHGPAGAGGAAEFTEARSTLTTSWAAPSLNDVFYRYNEDEVRHWIVFGRDGTPMPANGLEGGGAMSVQEVDQVVDYIRSVQITQGEALAEIEPAVQGALDRIAQGAATVDRLILEQEATLADTMEAPDRFAVIADYPSQIDQLLGGDGTCTDASAALIGTSCSNPGTDTDRDGISDAAELGLTEMGETIDETVVIRSVRDVTDDEGAPVVDDDGNRVPETVVIQDVDYPELFGLELDPTNPFTQSSATGEPIADLDRTLVWVQELDAAHLTLSVLTERNELFVGNVQTGLDFLEEAAEEQLWLIDFEMMADRMGVGVDEAERAAGLFNAYCARCHTAGYSAGVAFEQGVGTGAWGPSLVGGRAVVQFPDIQDQIDFVVDGSDDSVAYGINGLGSGRMPGFGALLSAEDIALIVEFERALP